PADRVGDRFPVGQGSAKPAVIDVVLGAAFGGLGNGIGSLTLRADEQHAPAARDRLGDLDERLVQKGHRLRQIDDMDLVARTEDVASHLWVPAVRLVTKVDASLEQLAHIEYGQHGCSFSGLPPRTKEARLRHRSVRTGCGPPNAKSACEMVRVLVSSKTVD